MLSNSLPQDEVLVELLPSTYTSSTNFHVLKQFLVSSLSSFSLPLDILSTAYPTFVPLINSIILLSPLFLSINKDQIIWKASSWKKVTLAPLKWRFHLYPPSYFSWLRINFAFSECIIGFYSQNLFYWCRTFDFKRKKKLLK